MEWRYSNSKATKEDITIQLAINDSAMHVNNSTVTLDSPACLLDGRTLVPVRAISEAFGTKVEWDGDARQVIITTDSFKYSGYGNKVITNVNIPAGYYYALYTHDGKRNFITHLYYGENSKEYVTNGLGICTERKALQSMSNHKIENGYLEVEADGTWAIEIIPVSGKTTTNISGCGETITGVFTATDSNNVITLTHDGERNFITQICPFGGGSKEYVTNEIGVYNAQRVVQLKPGGKYYIHIEADGNWTVDFGKGESLTSYPMPSLSVAEVSKDCVHETTVTPGKKATCTEDGITDEERCTKCGFAVKTAEVLKAYGHKYVDGLCATCGTADPNYKPSFGLGETWTVPGILKLTIDSIDIHEHCNSVANKDSKWVGEEVILVNYSYENLGYKSTSSYGNGGLFIGDFDIYDQTGDAGSIYPCTHEKNAQQVTIGKKCSASTAFVLFNKSNKITLEIDMYVERNGKTEKVMATFNVPLKKGSSSSSLDNKVNTNTDSDIYEITKALGDGLKILDSTQISSHWIVYKNRLPQTIEESNEIIAGISQNASKALPFFKKAMEIAQGISFSNDRLQPMLDSLYDECKTLSETESSNETTGYITVETSLIAVDAKASAAHKIFSEMQ